MGLNRKNVAVGAIFIAFGMCYGGIAWRTLPMGVVLDMGPGFFPVILSGLMVVIGAIVVIQAFVEVRETPFGVVPWRAVLMLSLSTIVFATFLDELGLFPSVLATALCACLSTREIGPIRAIAISACIAVFCTVIFGYGIKLPLPILGSWFVA